MIIFFIIIINDICIGTLNSFFSNFPIFKYSYIIIMNS